MTTVMQEKSFVGFKLLQPFYIQTACSRKPLLKTFVMEKFCDL